MNTRNILTKLIPAIATVCAILAAAPYELGEVATLIAPEWKPMILKISIAAYAVGRFVEWIAKTYFPEIPIESPKKPPILPLAILGAFLAFGLVGCQTRNWNVGAAFAAQDDAGNSVALDFRQHDIGIAFRNQGMELRLEGFAK